MRRETNPDDLDGMIAATGSPHQRGGKTVPRRRRRPRHGQDLRLRRRRPGRGLGAPRPPRSATGPPRGRRDQRSTAPPARSSSAPVPVVPRRWRPTSRRVWMRLCAGGDEGTADLVAAVRRLLAPRRHDAPAARRANADNAEDADRARRLGAQGIGLCRTEHMFLGDRRVMIERVVLAETDAEKRERARRAAAAAAPGLRRPAHGDGRPAGDDPAARPAAARVPAGPHRALGARSPWPRRTAAATTADGRSCSPRSSGCTSRTRCSACAACGSGCGPGPVRAPGACDRRGRRGARRRRRTRRSRSWSRSSAR